MAEFMDEMQAAGLVEIYEVEGQEYFQITKWSDHQQMAKPTPSRIPPDFHPTSTRLKTDFQLQKSGESANPDPERDSDLPRGKVGLKTDFPSRTRVSHFSTSPFSTSNSNSEPSTNSAGLFARTDLAETLKQLEAVWPPSRCRPLDEMRRGNTLMNIIDELPPSDELAVSAAAYIDAHGFNTDATGCRSLHRWLAERGWTDPLPKPKNSAEATVRNRRDRTAQIEAMTAEIIELADSRGEILDEQEAHRYAEAVTRGLDKKRRAARDREASAAGITLDNFDLGRLIFHEVTLDELVSGRLMDVEGAI